MNVKVIITFTQEKICNMKFIELTNIYGVTFYVNPDKIKYISESKGYSERNCTEIHFSDKHFICVIEDAKQILNLINNDDSTNT